MILVGSLWRRRNACDRRVQARIRTGIPPRTKRTGVGFAKAQDGGGVQFGAIVPPSSRVKAGNMVFQFNSALQRGMRPVEPRAGCLYTIAAGGKIRHARFSLTLNRNAV